MSENSSICKTSDLIYDWNRAVTPRDLAMRTVCVENSIFIPQHSNLINQTFYGSAWSATSSLKPTVKINSLLAIRSPS